MEQRAGGELDELVLTCLARIEEDGPSAIEEVCADHPEHAERLRTRMQALLEAGLLPEQELSRRRLGDFRLGRRLGGGAMGVVHAAVQEPLGREVAVKIVRADRLFFPGARERFRREVQLVSRLAHAGIVPVFTVGEEDGVPYFAMERLVGATLAEALAMLGGPPRRGRDLADAVARVVSRREELDVDVGGPLYAGSGVATCLRIGQVVAEALEHAHGRGVLHRDVKPSNVMLTADGRALLFDFGLASSRDSARLTESGSRVGSLAYMAPEQARGVDVDERSDVYGLGAVLCEALTGRPPHVGSPEEVVASLLAGTPAPFRGRRRDLPRDVVTLVETALAPEPARRYASAGELALDLGRALERRPIAARRLGPLGRGWSWARRHRARAALLALLVVAPAGFALQQYVARQRVSEQSDRAEANLDHALAALDVLVWGPGTDALQHVPHLDGERLFLLEEAAASLAELAGQRPDDARLRSRSLRLHTVLGTAQLDLGRLDEAEPWLASAIALGRLGPPEEAVPALNSMGILLSKRGLLDQAMERFDEALQGVVGDDYEALLAASAIQRNRARTARQLGDREWSLLTAGVAVDAARRALELATDADQRFEASHALGAAWNQRAAGTDLDGAQVPAEERRSAREGFEQAVPLLTGLASQRPRRSDVVHDAAAACVSAPHHRAPAEAEELVRRGLELIEPLVVSFPERLDYARTDLALRSNLGLCLVRQGRLDDGIAWFERAVEAGAPWLERDDEDLSLLREAGLADVNLASALVEAGRRSEACAPAARGAARLERVRSSTPGDALVRRSQAWAWIQDAYGCLARGDAEQAEALARRVGASTDAVQAVATGEVFAGCAALLADTGRAEQLAEEALDLLERGLEAGFTDLDYLRTAAEWEGLRSGARFRSLVDEARGQSSP